MFFYGEADICGYVMAAGFGIDLYRFDSNCYVMATGLHKVLLVSISCFCYGTGLGLVLVTSLQV